MINPPQTGHFRVVVDAARGLQHWQPSTKITTTPGQSHPVTQRIKSEVQIPSVAEEFKTKRNIYDDKNRNITPKEKSESAPEENGTTGAVAGKDSVEAALEKKAQAQRQIRFCHSCGQDCTRIHYMRNGTEDNGPLEKNARICPNCYIEGRFIDNDTTVSYTKVEDINYSRAADRDADWSDSELYLLLHALDTNEDDWHKIASFVGSRTAEECVQKFLQLEIEDKYIERATDQEAAAQSLPPYGRIPHSNIENPVMSVVSFLAAQSDKTVAAAAANRAVDAMKQSLQRRIDGVKSSDKDTSSKDKNALKSENGDVMEVDVPATDKENSELQGTLSNQVTIPDSGEVSTGDVVKDLATMSLATSAARAAALATHEERQMTTLVSAALNSTLEKLELKFKQFQEMEACLQMERLELEKAQQQLFLDRLAFKKRVKDVQELVRKGAMASGAAGVTVRVPGQETKLGFENVLTGRAEEDGKAAINSVNGLEMPSEGLKVKEL